jgi:aryl sulfotransferase
MQAHVPRVTEMRYRSSDEDSGRWDGFPFRRGDIVISTRSKSGTTWMQMICALLIFQTPDLPAPLPTLSPWLDWLIVPRDEVVGALEAQRHRRFIKTHTPLDGIPIDPRATYIVVGRHPLDMAVSLFHQGDNLNRERIAALTASDKTNLDKGHAERERSSPHKGGAATTATKTNATPTPTPTPTNATDVTPTGAPETGPAEETGTGHDSVLTRNPSIHASLLRWIDRDILPAEAMDSLPGVMWHLTDAWRRPDDNVMLVHYADLSADLGAEMRRIATRLGIDVPEDRWPALVDAAGFEQMRRNAEGLAPDPAGILKDRNAFFRRGRSGAGRELLTDAEFAHYEDRARSMAPDDLLTWLHR